MTFSQKKRRVEEMIQRAIENGWALCRGSADTNEPLRGRVDSRLGLCCIRGAIEIGHHGLSFADADTTYTKSWYGHEGADAVGLSAEEVFQLECGFEGWDPGKKTKMREFGALMRKRYA